MGKKYNKKDERAEDLFDLERARDNAITRANECVSHIHNVNAADAVLIMKDYKFSGKLVCGEYEDDEYSITIPSCKDRRDAIRQLAELYETKFTRANIESFLSGSIGSEDLVVEEYGGERIIRYSSMTLISVRRRII